MDNIGTLYILLSILFIVNTATFGFLLIKIKKLSKIAKSLDLNTLIQISQDLEKLKKVSQKSFQKIGVVKFNPFKSMGGNLSFAVAILNKLNEGLIISGLHNRESTRTYIKEISSGKDNKIELSSEERKALENAEKS
ncbi:MAG: DUF4446 family protein [Patescibacteria group bacterium]|nr:DUF4446 family protein [Patescibacteria group bacterium]